MLKKTDLSSLPQVAALRGPSTGAAAGARDLEGEHVFCRPRAHSDAALDRVRRVAARRGVRAALRDPARTAAPGRGLLISTAASFFLARALVRPLRALQEGAAQIGAGDLDRRIEVRTGDELEGLAEQFNQ